MTDDTREELIRLLKKFRFAMLTTMTADGKHVAHPLTVQEREFDGDLWFIIAARSSSVENLRSHKEVNVSFSGDDAWVSLTGTAEIVEDRAKLEELWSPAVDAWFESGPSDPNAALLKFTAEGAEYWHNTSGKIVQAIAALTGRRVEGDNATVDL